jgi:hypothetical protein
VAETPGALRIGDVNRLNLLEEDADVTDLDVGAQGAGYLDAIEQQLDGIEGPLAK